jgi:hypothetical protein
MERQPAMSDTQNDELAGTRTRSLLCGLVLLVIFAPFLAAGGAYLAAGMSAILGSAMFGLMCWLGGHESGRLAGLAVGERPFNRLLERLAQTAQQTHDNLRTVDETFAGLPSVARGGGHLYVVGFSTGAIKVGQTRDPRKRLREHRRDAGAYGVKIVNVWVSEVHVRYLMNETLLIGACRRMGTPARSEYFTGIEFDDAVACAARLIAPAQTRTVSA